eukprot:403368076
MVEEQSAGGCDLTEFKDKLTREVLPKTKFFKDFPKKGLNFCDIFSITTEPAIFRKVIDGLKHMIEVEIGKPGEAFNYFVGMESRGFLIAPILAAEYGLPFTAIRKKGKLPGPIFQEEYQLEYGSDICEIQQNVLNEKCKVVLLDDLLATGGTLAAAMSLVGKCDGATIVGSVVIFDIPFLKGRDKLSRPCHSLISLTQEAIDELVPPQE